VAPALCTCRIVTSAWQRPTGVNAASSVLLAARHCLSVLSYSSPGPANRHTPPKVTHTGSSTWIPHPETIWAPHCRLNVIERAGPIQFSKSECGQSTQAPCHTHSHAKQRSEGPHIQKHCRHSHQSRHWDVGDINMHAHTCTPPDYHTCTLARTDTRTGAQPGLSTRPLPQPLEQVGRAGV
jgi:hypothetical protein